jgi:hypothetical protein
MLPITAIRFVVAMSYYFIAEADVCDVYIAPSPLGGRGVFAGRRFNAREQIERNTGIIVAQTESYKWAAWNYEFRTPFNNIDVIMLGYGMVYNHGRTEHKNTRYYSAEMPPKESAIFDESNHMHYSTHAKIVFDAARNIKAGEEFVSHYGDTWFAEREYITYNEEPHGNTPFIPVAELKTSGYCLSAVEVRESSIPLAGNGLFAKNVFNIGDVVSVSPLLILPKHEIEWTVEHSVLINYVISAEGSDVALLPFTQMALANHGGVLANVKLQWLEWPAMQSFNGTVLSYQTSLEELMRVPFAPLDMKLVATRPIAAGEEVLLDYGAAWERAWLRYLQEKEAWETVRQRSPRHPVPPPHFRAAIGAGDETGLFPPHFFVQCLEGCESADDGRSWDFTSKKRAYLQSAFDAAKDYGLGNFSIYN